MTSLSGDLENEAIGEAERGPLGEELQCGIDNVGILNDQGLMLEQHAHESRE